MVVANYQYESGAPGTFAMDIPCGEITGAFMHRKQEFLAVPEQPPIK